MFKKAIFILIWYVFTTISFIFLATLLSYINSSISLNIFEIVRPIPGVLMFFIFVNQFIIISKPEYINRMFGNRTNYLSFHIRIAISMFFVMLLHAITKIVFEGNELAIRYLILGGLLSFVIFFALFVWVKIKANPFYKISSSIKISWLSNYKINKSIHIFLIILLLFIIYFHISSSGFCENGSVFIYIDKQYFFNKPIDIKFFHTLFYYEPKNYIQISMIRIMFLSYIIYSLITYLKFKIESNKK